MDSITSLQSRKRKIEDELNDDENVTNARMKKHKNSTNKNSTNDEKEGEPQDPEYQEIQGDLFLCPDDSALAHCVSQGKYQ